MTGGGCGLRNCFENFFYDRIALAEHVRIPKAENAITFGFEPLLSFGVALDFKVTSVLAAVQLNHKILRMAHEIHDKRTDRRLAAKAQSTEAVRAESHPESSFGIGHFRTHRFGSKPVQASNRPMCRGDTPLPVRCADRPPPQGGRWRIALVTSAHELNPPASVGTSSGLKP